MKLFVFFAVGGLLPFKFTFVYTISQLPGLQDLTRYDSFGLSSY